jgi:sortase A
MKRSPARALAALLLIGGGLLCAQALYPVTKGWVAMRLIADAYAEAPGSRPWPDADFRGVARLTVPRLDVEQIVLDQASPRVLAFGPGLTHRDPQFGPVISAHRDTHFRWIAKVRQGDELLWEQGGSTRRFRVAAFHVVDSRQQRIALPDRDSLLLTTCWPLDALSAGGSMRYVVTAIAMPDAM